MKYVFVFLAGMLARVLGLVLTHYASWLLAKVIEGVESGFDFTADLRRFTRWLVRGLAGGMSERSLAEPDDGYTDRWQPELYGR